MSTSTHPAVHRAECVACQGDEAPGPAQPLKRLLSELADVVGRIGDADYVRKPVGVIPGSVGGHVRHCLDHVTALLGALVTGHLDYDSRARGTPVETNRIAALLALQVAGAELDQLSSERCASPVRLHVLLAADAEPVEVDTSIGRELAYVLSHTIHHNAIIGAMVKTLGGTLPHRFGYAPSTIRHAEGR